MAINLFAPNDNGLTQLAGMQATRMDLPVKTVDYGALNKPSLDFMTMQQQAQNQLAQQQVVNQGALNVTQLENKGRLQVQNLVNKKLEDLQNSSQLFQANQSALQRNQIDIPTMQANIQNQQAQQQIAQQNANVGQFTAQTNAANQQGQLGIAQQQLEIQKKEAAQTLAMQHLTGMMALQDYQLKQVGALGAGSRAALLNATTPEQQQQVIANARQQALDLGIATPDNIDKIVPSDPSKFIQAVNYATYMAGTASDLKGQGVGAGLAGNLVMVPNAQGGITANIPLSDSDIKTSTNKLAQIQQQNAQIQNLIDSYVQNGSAWDTGANRFLVNKMGALESNLGLNPSAGDYQDLKDQKDQWLAQAQKLNVDYIGGLDNFKYSNRTQKLVDSITIQANDSPVEKLSKLKAIQQLNNAQANAINTRIRLGTSLNNAQQQDLSNNLDSIANQYLGNQK